MGLETRYNLDKLRLRAYNLLVEDQCHQAEDLLNERVEKHEPTHRLLEMVRLRERQLQVTGDNLEGAMKLLKDAKEATQHNEIGVPPIKLSRPDPPINPSAADLPTPFTY